MSERKTNLAEENYEEASLEELLLQSDLLAGMTRADGRILPIEKMVASEYLNEKNSKKSALLSQHFDYVVNDETTDVRVNTVIGFMSKLDVEDKYKLLRCLSAVAMCDGELDPREFSLIKQFAKAMDIDPNTI